MTAYIDSSVLLRLVLGQADQLSEWETVTRAVTSALTEVECLRTLDRRCRQGLLGDDELPSRRGLVLQLLERMERVDVTIAVLKRAADPYPTALGTQDAIHLSTAILWSTASGDRPWMATHDVQLAAASRSMGLDVVGCPTP